MIRRRVVILLLVLLARRADALTVTPLTFEQLVEEATAVVYARVAEVRGQWTADRQGIESVVTIEALRYLKGDLGRAVAMRLPGGEAGGRLNVLPGVPVLRQGDLVVLFLRSRGPSIPTLVGLSQGVFRVAIDRPSGGAIVTSPSQKSAAGPLVRGASDRRALPLDAFASEVRGILEASR